MAQRGEAVRTSEERNDRRDKEPNEPRATTFDQKIGTVQCSIYYKYSLAPFQVFMNQTSWNAAAPSTPIPPTKHTLSRWLCNVRKIYCYLHTGMRTTRVPIKICNIHNLVQVDVSPPIKLQNLLWQHCRYNLLWQHVRASPNSNHVFWLHFFKGYFGYTWHAISDYLIGPPQSQSQRFIGGTISGQITCKHPIFQWYSTQPIQLPFPNWIDYLSYIGYLYNYIGIPF